MRLKELGNSGVKVSAIGQGSMGVGGNFSPDKSKDAEQVSALRLGIEKGMTFIDTAEIYGGGHAEEVIGEAIKGLRNKVFVATKFSPEHSTYDQVIASANASLQRLQTDYIDLYQLHWPNPEVAISETMRAMEDLADQGKIKQIGVSNFSLSQLKEAQAVLKKHRIVSNQVEYNLFDRSIEKDLLPYCEKEKISIIAYSPLDQGKSAKTISGKTTLAWLIAHPAVIAIPKALRPEHIAENASAMDIELTKDEFEKISNEFCRPILQVPTGSIKVSVNGEGARKVYQTVAEALENRLGFCPSPTALANYIKSHPDEEIKPVRLVKSLEKDGQYEYDLVEGRVKYWAWVIAFDGKRPIPALIRG